MNTTSKMKTNSKMKTTTKMKMNSKMKRTSTKPKWMGDGGYGTRSHLAKPYSCLQVWVTSILMNKVIPMLKFMRHTTQANGNNFFASRCKGRVKKTQHNGHMSKRGLPYLPSSLVWTNISLDKYSYCLLYLPIQKVWTFFNLSLSLNIYFLTFVRILFVNNHARYHQGHL